MTVYFLRNCVALLCPKNSPRNRNVDPCVWRSVSVVIRHFKTHKCGFNAKEKRNLKNYNLLPFQANWIPLFVLLPIASLNVQHEVPFNLASVHDPILSLPQLWTPPGQLGQHSLPLAGLAAACSSVFEEWKGLRGLFFLLLLLSPSELWMSPCSFYFRS